MVLGGAGFLGSHIVDALATNGHQVRVFDRPNVSTHNLSESLTHLEIVHGDLTNPVDLSVALTGMEIVVHLVSTTLPQTSNDNPIYDVETNIIGSLNLLNLARDLGISKIVFASSGGTVYGEPLEHPIPETHPTNPICSYGITKLTIEKHLHLFRYLYGLDYVVLRPANPFGPRQNPTSGLGAIVTFLDKVLNDKAITIWGNGTVARDYFYVSDLVRALVRAIDGPTPSRVYNRKRAFMLARRHSGDDRTRCRGRSQGRVLACSRRRPTV